MFAPKRILVPTDFSENADHALVQAIELAKQYHAKIYLLHVSEPIPQCAGDYCPSTSDVIGAEESESRRSKERMQRELAKCPDIEGIEVITDVREGDTVAEILKEQDENGIDLIVMPSHGKTGWIRRLLGQVSEKVVEEAHSPVLMISH